MSNVVYPYGNIVIKLAKDYKKPKFDSDGKLVFKTKTEKKGKNEVKVQTDEIEYEVIGAKNDYITVKDVLKHETKQLPKTDENGQVVLENGKPVMETSYPWWTMTRKDRRSGGQSSANIMYSWVVQLLADLAGVDYDQPELIVTPTIQNAMTTVFMFRGTRKADDQSERVYQIGESNKDSSKIPYPVSIAYKRAHDRYVLDYLKMYDAYSEVEAEAFNKEASEPELDDLTNKERAEIKPWVEKINGAEQKDGLEALGHEIKEWINDQIALATDKPERKNRLTTIIKVLSDIYKKRMSTFNELQS